MSDPSLADAGLPPKRGWYDDPTTPGRDRWWSGSEWTELTARSPRTSMFDPAYERSMRARPNRPAAIGGWVGIAALFLSPVSGVAASLLGGVNPDPGFPPALLLMPQSLLAMAAIALGAIGLRGARRWGGVYASVYAMVVGVIALIMPVVAIGFGALVAQFSR